MSNPTILFVDDEPNVLNGLKRFCRSQRHVWNMHFVESGEAALDFLKSNDVDVVVSDMRMPGVTGADLFEQISAIAPGIIRIILSGEAEQAQTIRTIGRSHRFLAKPCDPESLIDAINAPLNLRNEINAHSFDKGTSYLDRLKSPESTFTELEACLRRPDISPSDVTSLVRRDPSLTARLLQLVNSAYFGRPVKTCNIGKAVEVIGCDRLLTLLENQRLGNHEEGSAQASGTPELADICAQHSHDAGAEQDVQDLAYLAGLFARLGDTEPEAGSDPLNTNTLVAPLAAYTSTLLGLPSYLSSTLRALAETQIDNCDLDDRARIILDTSRTIRSQAA